ncbi:MAG: hypothetical protein LC121_26630 [Anaerolineae bacterium]|nr:hypothetical protein [Anaerolineae bacterium]
MRRSPHRRWQSRIALLALFGLLWTQVVIAGHGLCVHESAKWGSPSEASGQVFDCHDDAKRPVPDEDAAACAAHCDQGDQRLESARAPLVMALPPDPLFPRMTDLGAEPIATRSLLEPVARRHGPTAHPTPLLLI